MHKCTNRSLGIDTKRVGYSSNTPQQTLMNILHTIHNVHAFLEAFESCKIKTTIGAMCKCYDLTFEMLIGISFLKIFAIVFTLCARPARYSDVVRQQKTACPVGPQPRKGNNRFLSLARSSLSLLPPDLRSFSRNKLWLASRSVALFCGSTCVRVHGTCCCRRRSSLCRYSRT